MRNVIMYYIKQILGILSIKPNFDRKYRGACSGKEAGLVSTILMKEQNDSKI